MSSSKKIQATEQEVEVLYQKLGDRWFAFSIVNDEVFMSPVSFEQVQEAKATATEDNTLAAMSFDFDNNGNPTTSSNS